MRLYPIALGLGAVFAGTQVYAYTSERKPVVGVTRCVVTENMVNWWDPAKKGATEEQSYTYIYPGPIPSTYDRAKDYLTVKVADFLDRAPPPHDTPTQTLAGEMVGKSHIDTYTRCLERAKAAGADLVSLNVYTHLHAVNGPIQGLWQPLGNTAFGRQAEIDRSLMPLDKPFVDEWNRMAREAETGSARIQRLSGLPADYIRTATAATALTADLRETGTPLTLDLTAAADPAPVPTPAPIGAPTPTPKPTPAPATPAPMAVVPPVDIPVEDGVTNQVIALDNALVPSR